MATLAKRYWKGGDGGKRRSFVVRVCGHDGYGNARFGILDFQFNMFRYTGYKTREDACADMNSVEC
jgi:hypothetical protein